MKKQLLKISYYVLFFSLLPPFNILAAVIEKSNLPEKVPRAIEVKLKDQFYIGVAIGYDSYHLTDHIKYYDKDHDVFVTLAPTLNLPGMVGEFIVGYGKYLTKYQRLYLGFEGFVDGSAADTSEQLKNSTYPLTIDTDITIKGGYGFSLVPGVKINRIAMLYAKLGYSWTMLEIVETTRNDGFSSVEYKESATTEGFSYGTGLQSAFNENFSLRAELNYTAYDDFTTDIGSKIKPIDTQFILSLIYHVK